MRRIIPVLLFLPFLVAITSLACGGDTSSDTQIGTEPDSTLAPTAAVLSPATGVDIETGSYFDQAGDALLLLVESLGFLNDLVANPMLGDDDWKIQVATAAAGIEVSYHNLFELEPPASAADLHNATLDAARDCRTGKDYFLQGLDNLDADSVQKAADMISSCGTKLTQAQILLDQYLVSPGLEPSSHEIPSKDATGEVNATVNDGANLRAGPGTDYAVVGGAKKGDIIELKARNEAGDWYRLTSGAWIAAFLVDNAPADLPVTFDVPDPGD